MRARILGLAALTLVVCACAGIQVTTEYNPEMDFTSYRTFAWVE